MATTLECVCCKAEANLECPLCGNYLCDRHKVCPECDGSEVRVYGDRDEPTLVNVYDENQQWVFDSQNRALDVTVLLNKRGKQASMQPMVENDAYSQAARELHNKRVNCFSHSGYTLKPSYVNIQHTVVGDEQKEVQARAS